MSISSGFGAAAVRDSRAMPQEGHAPGWSCTTSGCMGQTYSVREAGCGVSGSRAMPQEGHAPGVAERTSGHMGQT